MVWFPLWAEVPAGWTYDNLMISTQPPGSLDGKRIMDDRLRELAECRYRQTEFLRTLFELALEEQWFDLQHMVQHDMAKAILADYSTERGENYLNSKTFFDHWEDVIDIGWTAFCEHTGLSREKVQQQLQQIREV
jgi:hypothetical protein